MSYQKEQELKKYLPLFFFPLSFSSPLVRCLYLDRSTSSPETRREFEKE